MKLTWSMEIGWADHLVKAHTRVKSFPALKLQVLRGLRLGRDSAMLNEHAA